NRDVRSQSAAELRADLKRLKRDTDSGTTRGTRERFRVSRKLSYVAISLLGIVVFVAAIVWWKGSREGHLMTTSPTRKTVAVLPFGNVGGDKDIDFLRLALPDEIATTLSRGRSLSIRPFATTSKYINHDTDLQTAGQEMRVSNIVTGHFLKAGNQLQVT